MILRAREIDTLILFGIATSGVVLSIFLHASDNELSPDHCQRLLRHLDAEGHSYLIERFFPGLATATTRDQLINALGLR